MRPETVYSQRFQWSPHELSPTFRYDGMAQQVRVMVRLALKLSNATDLRRWLPGSEFQRPATAH